MKQNLLILVGTGGSLWMILDVILIPLIWRTNRIYASQKQFPESFLDRAFPSRPRWEWAVMTFDPNLRVTKMNSILFWLAGVIRWLTLLSIFVLLVK